MIYAHGPFNKLRMVCIIFLLTIIQFSHTSCMWKTHQVNLQCFDPHFVVVSVLVISKHYISQWYMPIDPSTSVGWFMSSFHWLPSSFIHQKGMWYTHQVDLQCFDPHFCCGCFNHIQLLYFSMVHAYRHFNKCRIVFINFSLTII